MERNKIEGLFKNKLEGLELEPSSASREKFAGMIRNKRQKVLIRRIGIAASILLFTFAGIYSYRTLNTDKIDLSRGESFDPGYDLEIAILKHMPVPRSIPAVQNKNPQKVTPDNYSINAQRNEEAYFNSATEPAGSIESGQEYNELVAGQEEESNYIEYFVADKNKPEDEQKENVLSDDQPYEPMKITIEYITSGEKGSQSESKRSNFYSKLDNMKTMEEVLGDIRTYKDRLFALDFKKEEKINNKEKSQE